MFGDLFHFPNNLKLVIKINKALLASSPPLYNLELILKMVKVPTINHIYSS